MITFAIDLSSDVGSVAVLKNGLLWGETELVRAQNRTAHLMDAIAALRRSVGFEWGEVDLFAAGCGPGRYSGLRVALTAVQHLALPNRRSVRAISSGAALAAAATAQGDEGERVLVIGDARRDRIWCGEFWPGDPFPVALRDWRLIELQDVPATFAQAHDQGPAQVVSAEWERLQPLLESINLWASDQWQPVHGWPRAEWVARLAEYEEQAHVSPAPPLPIYLHPPVAKADSD